MVLVQVPPPAQESGEGVPINKVEQQGAIASSKAMKQQLGGGRRYLKKNSKVQK
jgi:hypothetical protein